MARIRSQHPGQWTDDAFVSCSALARLLALGLRNEADDNGIFEWNPTKLKMRLLPADNCDVPALLTEIEASGQVHRYTVKGREYGIIRSFTRFQSPKKPTFQHPIPSEPLREGYALSKAYSPTSSPPVPHQSVNRPAEGSGSGEEPKTPQERSSPGDSGTARVPTPARASQLPEPPSPPAAFPPPDDTRATALHGLCCAAGVRVSVLDARQWVSEGVTEDQLRAALQRGEQRKNGTALNRGFLQLMLQDVRAGPAGYDAEAVIAQAIANIAAKEAANASH